MKRILLALFLSITSLTYSQNNDFQYLFDDVEKNEIWIKMEKSDNMKWTIWTKTVFPLKKYKNKKGQIVTTKTGHQLQYMQINCDDNTCSLYDYIVYDGKGIVVDSGNTYSINRTIFPETILAGIKEYLCE